MYFCLVQGIGDQNVGIYVKKVVDGSAAHRDGRLEMGDQLLSVNGHSLVGITQEQAAGKISQAGSDVNFEVAKRAAYTNGIIESLEKGTVPNTPSISHFSQQNGFQKLPNQTTIQDPQLYRHNRSASASELFANQPDNISMASVSQVMPNGNSKLPAHYKQSNRPIVIQPQRPSAMPSPTSLRKTAPSPTPIYSQMNQQGRSQSTIPFNQHNQQPKSYLENYSNLPQINHGHFRQNSSNNSSPLPAAPPISRPSEAIFQASHFPPAPVKTISGRSSAPLFDHPTRTYSSEMKSTRHMTSEELDSELDAIESKGDAMTQNDIARYHELLGRIAELRGPIPLSQSRSTTEFGNIPIPNNSVKYDPRQTRSTMNGIGEQHRIVKPPQPLPFMNEMASKLESKKFNEKNGGTFLPKMNLADSLTEKAIDDVTQQFKIITSTPLTPQTEQPSTSMASSLPRPAMRDNSISPEDKSKKRVQFRDEQSSMIENGFLNNNHHKNDEMEPSEPRSRIVGNNEVYLNDPRQRRLNEIQQKSIKPVVDGTHLAFRDKMRMFATQLGESTPKEKQKVSSAQREIENSNEIS
uniref:PDZ domain-containing protein n=1 Tax=Panagrolaimus sp. JU765 TaxID=591449 RepID=A0AC34PVU7_9BILA